MTSERRRLRVGRPAVADVDGPAVELVRFRADEWRDDTADAARWPDNRMMWRRGAYERWTEACRAHWQRTGVDPCPVPVWEGVPVDPQRTRPDPWHGLPTGGFHWDGSPYAGGTKAGDNLAWRRRFQRD